MGGYRGYIGFRVWGHDPPIMENRMEKEMEN